MKSIKINVSTFPQLYIPKYESFALPLNIHPLNSLNIAIIYPGANGSSEGFNNKYIKIAESLIEKDISAVIRIPNKYYIGYPRTIGVELAINYALKHSNEICGSKTPNLYLIGHSIGAGAIDILSTKYQQIKKILLTSPCPIIEKGRPIHNLERYRGELYVIIGKNDLVVPKDLALYFYHCAINTSKKKLQIVKNCDHDFKGDENFNIFINLASKYLK